MAKFSVSYADRAVKQLKKLDLQTRRLIIAWIEKNLVGCTNPRAFGKGLTSERGGEWRYRVGDYRILADIRDKELLILVIEAGHRSKIYKYEKPEGS